MNRTSAPTIYVDVPQEMISIGRIKVIDSLKGFILNNYQIGVKNTLPDYISNQSTSGTTRSKITSATVENMIPWISYGYSTYNNNSYGSFIYLSSRYIDSSIPAAANGTGYYSPSQISIAGSIGYGVGGSSYYISGISSGGSAQWGEICGNTGDIVKTTIILQDTAPIAVSVGCGGGSAGYVTNNLTGLNGNDGTSSTGGASNGQNASASGFCNGVPADNIRTIGGGVNGCVAIWF